MCLLGHIFNIKAACMLALAFTSCLHRSSGSAKRESWAMSNLSVLFWSCACLCTFLWSSRSLGICQSFSKPSVDSSFPKSYCYIIITYYWGRVYESLHSTIPEVPAVAFLSNPCKSLLKMSVTSLRSYYLYIRDYESKFQWESSVWHRRENWAFGKDLGCACGYHGSILGNASSSGLAH